MSNTSKERSKWEIFLDANFCSADPITGNRPCDSEALCDRCNTEDSQEWFENWKKDSEQPVNSKGVYE